MQPLSDHLNLKYLYKNLNIYINFIYIWYSVSSLKYRHCRPDFSLLTYLSKLITISLEVRHYNCYDEETVDHLVCSNKNYKYIILVLIFLIFLFIVFRILFFYDKKTIFWNWMAAREKLAGFSRPRIICIRYRRMKSIMSGSKYFSEILRYNAPKVRFFKFFTS